MLAATSRVLARIEDGALAVVLVGLIGLASTQILLRNAFDTGFLWADELIRLMVLWLAVFGAVAASRTDRHIRIDILARLLPAKGRLVVAAIVDLLVAALLVLLAVHAFRFVRDAYAFEDTLLGGLPAWWFQAILPLGFGLMALHQLVLMVQRVLALVRGGDAGETPA